MKIERTKNAARNIVFDGLMRIWEIIIPFLMRTVMLYFLGVQYVGLNSLFKSILQVLNLAELGVGSAMVYSMFKPIAEDDEEQICALMKLYRTYYRWIGIVIAVVGLLLTPFIPSLIDKGPPEDLNVYVLYLLHLASTVLSYWLFAYRNCIFTAHQRTDVASKVRMATHSVQYLIQLLVLIFLKNYYIYLMVTFVTLAATNIITAYFAKKEYPRYDPRGELDKETVKQINQRVKDLFTTKIGSVIVNSVDTIVISAFLGLAALAIYQNYFFIITSITTVVSVIFNACLAGIGNSVIVETKEKNFGDLKKFTFIIVWIAGFCASCLLSLYQPFMRIWVGEELLLGISVVVCLCVYYFVNELNLLFETFKDAAGLWHFDRFRPLVTALVNLTLNLATVKSLGLYGVLLSTVISMLFIGMPWILHNLFTQLFSKELLKGYIVRLLCYSLIAAGACAVTFGICSLIHGSDWVVLLIRGVLCCIIPNVIFFFCYRTLPEFTQSVQLIEKMTKGRVKLGRLLAKN